MSKVRDELRRWLGQIEVSGRVLDVGGLACPMRNQVKDEGITEYRILDKKEERKEVRTNYVYDLNEVITLNRTFDVIFCTETMQFVYDPVVTLMNIKNLLEKNGLLYITFHLTHPKMKGTDYLRYTREGVIRLLEETGFEIEYIKEPVDGYYLVKAICQR